VYHWEIAGTDPQQAAQAFSRAQWPGGEDAQELRTLPRSWRATVTRLLGHRS
jgi:hypothetical protein